MNNKSNHSSNPKKFFYIRQDTELKVNELYSKFKKEENTKSFSEFSNKAFNILYDLLITPNNTPISKRVEELKGIKNSQLEDIDILVKSLRSGVNINLYMLLSLYNRITVEGWVPEDLESFAVVSQNDEINRLIDRIGVLLKEDVARGKEIKESHKKRYN